MSSVCFIYGFCEGPRMSKGMLRALKRAGHTVTTDLYKADVVIAHSAGCFLVPKDLRAKQIIMIGLTHWPGKSLVWALVQKNWNDFHCHRRDRKGMAWVKKFAWNTIYFWNMRRNLAMWQARTRGDYWQVKRLTLIRNQEDTFCTPDLASLPFTHKPRFVELPDQHDDCWLHPTRYVAVIQ